MAVIKQWKVKPQIDPPRQGIWLGPGSAETNAVWLGTLAEVVAGGQPKIWLGSAKEQVVAVVGKRGSGKSFTLGVLVEGLTAGAETALSRQSDPRAVLVFDPLDIYWTTRYAVSPSANAEADRHYQLARTAGLPPAQFRVDAWVPGEANRRRSDPDWFQTLKLSVPALGYEEWELLVGVNMMSEPMGQALVDALQLVRDTGYRIGADSHDPMPVFDLAAVAEASRSVELDTVYHPETLRALRQRVSALAATGLFASSGTVISDLLAPGHASVILLSRLPQSYRAAIVAVLTRMLIYERSSTAFAEKRLALDPELTGHAREELEAMAAAGVPRTVVVLDEAQSFLAPGMTSPAKSLFVRLVKEGRNMGLSAILATQQPSALDARILSQVETFIAHQLVTDPDIRAVRENLKSSLPASIQFGASLLDAGDLLRQLPPGVSLISAADMNTAVRRAILVSIRPRASVHGGIEL